MSSDGSGCSGSIIGRMIAGGSISGDPPPDVIGPFGIP